MTKIKEIFKIIFRKNEEDGKMKAKWSLKKKLLIGGGLVSGAILGIFAYGRKHEEEIEDGGYFEDEDGDDYETDETENLDDINVSVDDEVETQA
jgi:hypothetical protein